MVGGSNPLAPTNRPLAAILLLVLVYATGLGVLRTAGQVGEPEILALAVAADFVLVVPAFYWLVLVWRRGFPLLGVLPLALLGLGLVSSLLPNEQDALVRTLAWGAVPLEGAALIWLGMRAWRVGSAVRTCPESDVADRLRIGVREVLGPGRAAEAIAFESALLWYAFGSWRRRASASGFSYHRRAGYGAVLCALVLVLVVETVAMHLLVRRFSPTLAWVLTAGSLYALVWLAAEWRAARLRPIELGPDALEVRCGLRWSASILYDRIVSLRPIEETGSANESGVLAVVPLGAPQLVLELDRAVEIRAPYGIKRAAPAIGSFGRRARASGAGAGGTLPLLA